MVRCSAHFCLVYIYVKDSYLVPYPAVAFPDSECNVSHYPRCLSLGYGEYLSWLLSLSLYLTPNIWLLLSLTPSICNPLSVLTFITPSISLCAYFHYTLYLAVRLLSLHPLSNLYLLCFHYTLYLLSYFSLHPLYLAVLTFITPSICCAVLSLHPSLLTLIHSIFHYTPSIWHNTYFLPSIYTLYLSVRCFHYTSICTMLLSLHLYLGCLYLLSLPPICCPLSAVCLFSFVLLFPPPVPLFPPPRCALTSVSYFPQAVRSFLFPPPLFPPLAVHFYSPPSVLPVPPLAVLTSVPPLAVRSLFPPPRCVNSFYSPPRCALTSIPPSLITHFLFPPPSSHFCSPPAVRSLLFPPPPVHSLLFPPPPLTISPPPCCKLLPVPPPPPVPPLSVRSLLFPLSVRSRSLLFPPLSVLTSVVPHLPLSLHLLTSPTHL
ncbi:unnamed protein product [Acanthosepion pharaonis]|uniref:Uncharacterized protein n=1 Tax=Acanthosepion pharaonis TaxID=158019 RepID=A0A812AYS6_ACAPH|nr:unnamed protein product [Sepia pharaonis]